MTTVAVVMGSKSDYEIMKEAVSILKEFKIETEVKVVSAHRTPEFMFEFAKNAEKNGTKIIIAGAGGAAHLPGMIASLTHLPVIGVPIKSTNSIGGIDSLLSIVQMPSGVPVATVGIDNGKNAGLLAISILALEDAKLSKKLIKFRSDKKEKVLKETL
jgi:5-(carboxyamino)imidazole ribonucleotide mutase